MFVHDYFKRNSAHWGILDFLNNSTEEPFKLKIDSYLKALEIIMNSEQGKRRNKAKLLYDDYKKEPRSDKKKASNWEKERSRKQVHIYQPAYTDISSSGTINEINGINNSTSKENEGELSVRRSPRYKRRVSYVEVEDSDEDSDEEKKSRKLKRVNSHLQSTESPQQSMESPQQSTESLQSVPSTPPQAPRDLSPLMTTPNKRPLERKIQQYSECISVICAFSKTVSELILEVGEDLTIELSTVRDANPAVWTPALENYVDTVLKKTGNSFKIAVLDNVPDELFRLYCEKVLIDFYNLVDINPTMEQKIGERKYITYQISSIFKYYERTFSTLNFDWIESHARSAKIAKSVTNSGIVKVDAQAIRYADGLTIWHMEVAGGPCNSTDLHISNDTKKTLRMDVLNLIAILRNHFDCEIELATKIKVFCTQVIGTRMTLYALSMLPDGRFISSELATATVPFSFHGRNQFKAIFRMMAIFHNEITKQEELMGEIDRVVLRSKGTTVRHVLKIPEELFDINAQIDAVLRYAQ